MRKRRHDKKVEKMLNLTGRAPENYNPVNHEPERLMKEKMKEKPEKPNRVVDRIPDRDSTSLERVLRNLYDDIPQSDRVVNLFGLSDDRLTLDDEIEDHDLVIDLDSLEFMTGRQYKENLRHLS